jgi:simple sugar transport system permease protein
MMEGIRGRMGRYRRFAPVAVTMTLFFLAYAYGAIAYDAMRDPQVFLNMLRAAPFLLISAIGMTFVIVSGGIDLSVGGVVALTTVASAALLRGNGMDPWLVMGLMLVMGMAFGAAMGFFITYLKVQPFIATLAGMWVARGLCFFISDNAIPIKNRLYEVLAGTKLLIPGLADPVTKQGEFVSILVVVELAFLVVAIFVAHYTGFGRAVYAIGGNELSARLMGLPVNRTKMLVYTLSGLCSALAGIALSIDVGSGHGSYAKGMELTVIAAVVIGGTLLTGGVGYVFGTLFGVLVIGVIQTLIQFNGQLSSWWTPIVVGVLTLVFIGIQSSLATDGRARRAIGRRAVGAAPLADAGTGGQGS